GVLVMRDLMLSDPNTRLGDMMFTELFTLQPEMPLLDAMNLAINRHFPIYPVCDDDGRLIGLVRGQAMFEAHAIDISAQAGSMVGVEKVERLTAPFMRSLRFRHPWLQMNLLTCFIAAAVVAVFEDTLNRVVVLAAFLPVVAGQAGNTGSQALAVTLRGIVLGDLNAGDERTLVIKECFLGLTNGVLVGLSAALGMFFYARLSENPRAFELAGIVWLAMVVSCLVGGLSGAVIPLALRRFGTDPATASSIFLTTITDAVSMGVFLGLASALI
ncbi:MAG: magnesium transporter, partial [Planctomycetota bacterium]